MIAIILLASPEAERRAIEAGFKKETVLVRHHPVMSSEQNKEKIESEVSKLKPFQFLVSNYWGMQAE